MTVEVMQGEQGLAFSINGAPERRLPWVDGLPFRNGNSYLTFRRAGGVAAHELRYDAGSGLYVLKRQ